MLRRSQLKTKPKIRRVLWRSGRVIEDARGMQALRSQAFKRSGGRCENVKPNGVRCRVRVSWWDGELHHVISRAHGGSDIIENVAFFCFGCHQDVTGRPQFGKRNA
jgi:5-methylcytosine-specific restriction endonuclease McrA